MDSFPFESACRLPPWPIIACVAPRPQLTKNRAAIKPALDRRFAGDDLDHRRPRRLDVPPLDGRELKSLLMRVPRRMQMPAPATVDFDAPSRRMDPRSRPSFETRPSAALRMRSEGVNY